MPSTTAIGLSSSLTRFLCTKACWRFRMPLDLVSSLSSSPLCRLRENCSPEPLLVVFRNVPIDELRSETGGDPMAVIKWMEETRHLQILWPHCNFELQGALRSNLSLFTISPPDFHTGQYNLSEWLPKSRVIR